MYFFTKIVGTLKDDVLSLVSMKSIDLKHCEKIGFMSANTNAFYNHIHNAASCKKNYYLKSNLKNLVQSKEMLSSVCLQMWKFIISHFNLAIKDRLIIVMAITHFSVKDVYCIDFKVSCPKCAKNVSFHSV